MHSSNNVRSLLCIVSCCSKCVRKC